MENPPVTSLKKIKDDIEVLKRQVSPVDTQLLLRLLDYIEAREKMTKELLIHMNAVENHLVRTTELLQKLPQVNIGLLADSLQAMIPKLDEIAYNTRKMVDYLEMATEVGGTSEKTEESKEEVEEEKEAPKKKKEGGASEQLSKIEEQNKSLLGALNKLSESLNKMGSE
jgi:hypothetical protein